jgi:hypothetical protein
MIRVPQVRVLDEDGAQLGVMPTHQALAMAQERGFDLVEVAPTAAPPVVKFLDFGQYKYELTKRDKEAKRKQRAVEFKEVRLTPKIGQGDFDTKVHRAIEFPRWGPPSPSVSRGGSRTRRSAGASTRFGEGGRPRDRDRRRRSRQVDVHDARKPQAESPRAPNCRSEGRRGQPGRAPGRAGGRRTCTRTRTDARRPSGGRGGASRRVRPACRR